MGLAVSLMQTSSYTTSCQPAAAGVGFDADAVVGAFDRKIGHADGARAAIGLAADRHSMAVIKVIVRNRYVAGRSRPSGFDGDVVVARADKALCDGDVGAIAGVDSVGVAAGFERIDNHTPGGESVAAAVSHVKIRRVLHADAIEREIVGAGEHQDARAILIEVGHFGLLRQIPPGHGLACERGWAVDPAIAHHRRMRHVVAGDQRSAAVAQFVHHAAATPRNIVVRGLREANRMDLSSTSSVTPARNCSGPAKNARISPEGFNSTAWPAAQLSSAS